MIDQNLKIKVIKNGTKIVNLKYDALKICFRDTMNFIPSPLASFPRSIGLDPGMVAKVDFPHQQNLPVKWDKILYFPDLSMYVIEKWDSAKRDEFRRWHASEKQF